MVLLDALSKLPNVSLVVAHFNHGIRDDAVEDEKLVIQTAKKYGLPVEVGKEKLGSAASEAVAREARYRFIDSIKNKYDARAIITAHHQDDLIETAFINILRGTGPRGLTAISDNKDIIRPFLKVSKTEVLDYAAQNKILWREDSTNKEEKYLRNYLRLNVIPRLSAEQRSKLLKNLNNLASASPMKVEALEYLNSYLLDGDRIIRSRLSGLPNDVASEFIAHWLRIAGFYDYDKKLINNLLIFVKTGQQSTRLNLGKSLDLVLSKTTASLETSDR